LPADAHVDLPRDGAADRHRTDRVFFGFGFLRGVRQRKETIAPE
jgi:hypothetical protein